MTREIALIFVMAGLLGALFKFLKQPMIPALVLAGIILGPLALNWVSHPEQINGLSEFAVVVMLFVIGAEMDITRLKKLGMVAILGGTVQSLIILALGFGLGKLIGLNNITATYMGIAAGFSSTMLVVKILGEKYQLNTLYGKIVVGTLIIQDVLAIFALSIMTTIDNFSVEKLTTTVLVASGLILIVVLVCSKYVYPRLFDFAAKERETLFMVAMALVFGVALIADFQHLSLSIGAFLVGLGISNLAYQHEIIGDMKAMKTFFTILLFASLGLQLAPNTAELAAGESAITALMDVMSESIWLIVGFTILGIVIKPLVIMTVVSAFGYKKSTSFEVGLSLGQFSEFSLVLIAQGIIYKHLDQEILPPIIVVTVLSMTVSSYTLKWSQKIYQSTKSLIGWLDKLALTNQGEFIASEETTKANYQVVLFGCGNGLGMLIEMAMRQAKLKYIVIDNDPEVIARLHKDGCKNYIFGNACSHEVWEKLDMAKVHTVITVIDDHRDVEFIINHVNHHNSETNIVTIIDDLEEAVALYDKGAHLVVAPHMVAAQHLLATNPDLGCTLRQIISDTHTIRERGKVHRKSLIEEGVATVATMFEIAAAVEESQDETATPQGLIQATEPS